MPAASPSGVQRASGTGVVPRLQRCYVECEGLANHPKGPANDPGRALPPWDRAVILPPPASGSTTDRLGYFEVGAADPADWMVSVSTRFGPLALRASPHSPMQSCRFRRRTCCRDTSACPSATGGSAEQRAAWLRGRSTAHPWCARVRMQRALRVENAGNDAMHPARLLRVHGPHPDRPLPIERFIVAANDGGRWVLRTTGTPYPSRTNLHAHAHEGETVRLGDTTT